MSPTLLLNATYEPVTVVSAERAVTLVLMGDAEMIESTGQVMRSPSIEVPIPSVIRLLKFVRVPYKREVRLTPRGLMARDNHTCQYCGGKAESIDHVHPRAKGGRHTWENVVAACNKCNGKKADKTLAELGWTLPRKPVAPTSTHWVVVGIAAAAPDWEPYLVGFKPQRVR